MLPLSGSYQFGVAKTYTLKEQARCILFSFHGDYVSPHYLYLMAACASSPVSMYIASGDPSHGIHRRRTCFQGSEVYILCALLCPRGFGSASLYVPARLPRRRRCARDLWGELETLGTLLRRDDEGLSPAEASPFFSVPTSIACGLDIYGDRWQYYRLHGLSAVSTHTICMQLLYHRDILSNSHGC